MESSVCQIHSNPLGDFLTNQPIPAWYAIRTKPRFEKKVALGLRGKGYEDFLPVRRVRRAKQDRTVTVEHPLFPGYLFCRFDCSKRLPILVTPGVINILSNQEQLTPVPEEEISSLQRVVEANLAIHDAPYLPGSKVHIINGPLTGVSGIVTRSHDSYRVVVSVEMLQRSIAVEIAADSLSTAVTESVLPLSA
jgi:transcription antitermination factor NusG